MTDTKYALRSIAEALPATLAQYLEAQYHIWDESLVESRRHLLDKPGTISSEPYIEATPAYVPGKSYDRLAIPQDVSSLLMLAAAEPSAGVPTTPYSHQAKALEKFFEESLELIISTGTGSGKTESFLMPILGSLAIERSQRITSYARSATRALLLYPMNALVNDQMSRLRRLIASSAVTSHLVRPDGFKPSFGMYTSRTPYPGVRNSKRDKEDVGAWIDRFFGKYAAQRNRLMAEGKWPAKNLAQFRQSFSTSIEDSELLTRHEMHQRPPDLLVTNYSMLEYMLLRPVDSPIFNSTRDWLATHQDNFFTVVLDEAHMYQGAQGTEVALLLRRLLSRLRVARERVRFILTSASLASGVDADKIGLQFAAELTGAREPRRFAFISGELSRPVGGRPANKSEAAAFSRLDVDCLLSADHDLQKAQASAAALSDVLDFDATATKDAIDLRHAMFAALVQHPVWKELAAQTMARPKQLSGLAMHMFPTESNGAVALDGLLAATSFARARTNKPLLPMRAHFMFRGLGGVFACVDPQCTARHAGGALPVLGQLYSRSRTQCDCGARVYELLTHRDCGAAYLRAYYRPAEPDFLWHEPSTGRSGQGQALTEVHLLVEHTRDQIGNFNRVWLSKKSGQLTHRDPGRSSAYIELRQPTAAPATISGRSVITFDRECPVCLGRWSDRTRPKIMDLATKGEDPFAHLIATQVRLQPSNVPISRQSPNAGRKSLLFSDGRQKAARLARDVPRVIEQDAFRQVILLAASCLQKLKYEARISDSALYVSFLAAVSEKMLHFFDGADSELLQNHLRAFEDSNSYAGDLSLALRDPWEPSSPQAFRMHVMRVLGSRFYSLYALGLGYVRPRNSTTSSILSQASVLGLSAAELEALTTVWVQGCLEDFALFGRAPHVTRRSRELAAGYPVTQAGTTSGFTRKQKVFLKQYLDVPSLESIFQRALTEPGDTPDRFLLVANNLKIVPAVNHPWFRCKACTNLAPLVFRDRCTACGSTDVIAVPAGGDTYLRARKAFWRDPAERVLSGAESPITLDVQEHTAQLGYRDLGALEATTESYERRFRDILIGAEKSIDVLSCTTTMEVGIDIGSLLGVGLRNMPPSRHNYQQRAGRSGRRGSAVSTVITFAQNNAHDSYMFDHAEELIAGPSKLSGLDVSNPALVRRHAYAEMLQEFFEDTVIRRGGSNVFATLGQTKPFFEGSGDGSLAALREWLTRDSAGFATLARIGAWIPQASGITQEHCRDALLSRLEELRASAKGTLPRGEEQLIEFCFARGILPAYAFPRDLVALQVENLDAHGQVQVIERPQQGAHIALSEYAPGRLVVVNKQTFRIGAVTADLPETEVSRARPLFAQPTQYLQCSNCLHTASPSAGRAGSPCPSCRTAQLQLVTVIQPEVVWPQGCGPIDELDDDQLFTETTVAQLPVPASQGAFESEIPWGPASQLLHGRNVPLIIMNRGELGPSGPAGFQVCEQCGFAVSGGQPFPTPHDRHYLISRRGQRFPRQCAGAGQSVFLGYDFRTDVLLLRIPLAQPFLHDLDLRPTWPPLRAALNSLANALALTSASALDIDPRDLQCGFRLQRTADGAALADVYIYDTLSGGAGYSRLVGEDFDNIFRMMQKRLAECDCDSSCTKCLRTYSNRITHESLDRFLALDLAAYSATGIAPQLIPALLQKRILAPIVSIIELAGWTTARSDDGCLTITRGDQSARVFAAPPLLDSSALPPEYRREIVFSSFEIAKDLPSCITKLPL